MKVMRYELKEPWEVKQSSTQFTRVDKGHLLWREKLLLRVLKSRDFIYCRLISNFVENKSLSEFAITFLIQFILFVFYVKISKCLIRSSPLSTVPRGKSRWSLTQLRHADVKGSIKPQVLYRLGGGWGHNTWGRHFI